MITQCPSCQTRFRLPLDQVATSRGEVLCGECHAQFNALDYLVIEEGIKPGKPTLTVRASKGDENVNSNTLFLPIDEDVIANLLSEREPDESPEEANTPAETSVIEEELSPQLTPITRQATPTAADVLLQETLKRAEESHVQEERIEKEELSEEPVEIVFEKKEEPIPSQPSSPPEKYQLSQNLEESPDEQAHFSLGSLLLSITTIGILIATLGLQYLVIQREHFSQHPYFRPILTTVCPIIDCSVAPKRALSLLSIVDNRIETHPRYANALQITAELINQGNFEQNYPVVELVMTNIQQEVVASRNFYPDEYLSTFSKNETTPFAANSSNQLRLEVVDPGSHATGFEFILHNRNL